VGPRPLWRRYFLPRDFSSFFWTKTSVAFLWSWVEEDFTYRGHSTHEILPSFKALTNEAERTLDSDLPRHGAARAKAPDCQRR